MQDGSDAAVQAKMPFCAPHVDYTFCVRKFTSAETTVSPTAIEEADAAAKLCHGDTFWEEGPSQVCHRSQNIACR